MLSKANWIKYVAVLTIAGGGFISPALVRAECSSDPNNLLQNADCDLDSGSAAAWTVTPSGSVSIQTDVNCPPTAPSPIVSLEPATGTALGRSGCIDLGSVQGMGTYTAGGYVTRLLGDGTDICRIGVEVFQNDDCTGSSEFVENNNVNVPEGTSCQLGIMEVTVGIDFESAQMIVACIAGGANTRADNWFLIPGSASMPVELLRFSAA